MSRRTVMWRRKFVQGMYTRDTVYRIIPTKARGTGEWLGKGDGKGAVCTEPMAPEKQAKVVAMIRPDAWYLRPKGSDKKGKKGKNR